jgi:hypothetical protein
MADSLEAFLHERGTPERTLAVVDPEQPKPIHDLFVNAFGSLNVGLSADDVGVDADDSVVLLEEGDVVATSSIESLRETVLLVNSDLYTTGLSGIDERKAPSVLTELDGAVYTLRGFPASTKEKLLLIVMSRYIERRALEAGEGRLDVAFQQLSRMRGEYGTKRTYERLLRTDLDVHVYGVPDTDLGDIDATVHTGRSRRYRRSWFVVFAPPDGGNPAALVAVETDRNTWRATWTYDRGRVGAIQDHIVERF